MILYYVRHGSPVYNPDSLTPLGRRQAESVGRMLACAGLDAVYASSSNRAIETAQPAAEICRLGVSILDWCNEGHAWDYTSVARNDGSRAWCFLDPECIRVFLSREVRDLGDDWADHPWLAACGRFREGFAAVDAQVDAFIASLGYVHDRKGRIYLPERDNDAHVALFAHEGFGKMFLSSLLDIPYPDICTHFAIGHSAVTAIQFKPGKGASFVVPCVLALSSQSHLLRDGLPVDCLRR
jgi:probable phosphoglycerate mutase